MSDKKDLKIALYDAIENSHAGMLSLHGTSEHPQPMSPFLDRDAGKIWFISSTDTDFVQSLGAGGQAQFTVISKDRDVHGSVRGRIARVHDTDKLEELWSPVVGAWFDGGKDDPKVALLCMNMEEAAVWESESSALMFGWEILRANMSEDHKPDVGHFDVLRFAA